MVKRSIQGYVELASGLGELTRAKAVEAAQELMALSGSDASNRVNIRLEDFGVMGSHATSW